MNDADHQAASGAESNGTPAPTATTSAPTVTTSAPTVTMSAPTADAVSGDVAQDQFPMKLELSKATTSGGPAGARFGAGCGVMGARSVHDEPAARVAALEQAANTARTTGHRFDLLRYLRLKRSRDAR